MARALSDARRRDATRRAAGVTRTSLSLAVSLALFPSIVFSRFCSPSFSPISLSLSFSLSLSSLLRFSPSFSVTRTLWPSSRLPRSCACPQLYLCLSSDAHRSPLACIVRYTCTRTYMCVYVHRAVRTLFVAGPAENTDLSPSASSPSTPAPLFWGFYTLSRAATTKPRASTMICCLSYSPASAVARMRVSRISMIERNKKIKKWEREREKEFRLLFSRTVGLLGKLFTHTREFASSFSNLCLKATLYRFIRVCVSFATWIAFV